MVTYNDEVLEEASKIEKILSNPEVDEAFSSSFREEESVQLKKYLREKLGKGYQIILLGATIEIPKYEGKNYSLRIRKIHGVENGGKNK